MILACIAQEMKKAPLIMKCLLGAVIITIIELIFGYIFNIKYQMNVWNYENMPMNLFGQICLPFSALWFLLCFILFKWVIKDDLYSRFF